MLYSEEALIIISMSALPRKLKIIHLAVGLVLCRLNQPSPRWTSILSHQRGDLNQHVRFKQWKEHVPSLMAKQACFQARVKIYEA